MHNGALNTPRVYFSTPCFLTMVLVFGDDDDG